MLKIKYNNEFDTKIASKILLEIDEIIKTFKYEYLLVGGTLLGCIRHGSFMEWDDDIDLLLDHQAIKNLHHKKIFERKGFNTRIFWMDKDQGLNWALQITKDSILTDLWPSRQHKPSNIIETCVGDFPIEKTYPSKIVEFEGNRYAVPYDPYYYLDSTIGPTWKNQIIKRIDTSHKAKTFSIENFYGSIHHQFDI